MSFPASLTTPKRDAFLRYAPGGAQLEKVIHLSTQYAEALRAVLATGPPPAISSSLSSSPSPAINRKQWRDKVHDRKAKVLSIENVQQHLLAPLLQGRSADLSALLDPWATVLRDMPTELVERHQKTQRAESVEQARDNASVSQHEEDVDLMGDVSDIGGSDYDLMPEDPDTPHHEQSYRLPTPRDASISLTPQITPTPRGVLRSSQASSLMMSSGVKNKSKSTSGGRLQQLRSEESGDTDRPRSHSPDGTASRSLSHTSRSPVVQRPKSRLGHSSVDSSRATTLTSSSAGSPLTRHQPTPLNASAGRLPTQSPLVEVATADLSAARADKKRAAQRARCAAWKSRNLRFSNGSIEFAAKFSEQKEIWEAAGLLPLRPGSAVDEEDEGVLDEGEREMFVGLFEMMEDFCEMVDDITSTMKSTRTGGRCSASRSTTGNKRKRSAPTPSEATDSCDSGNDDDDDDDDEDDDEDRSGSYSPDQHRSRRLKH